jgi:DNA-binding MarR family transcriptional regulator
LRIAPSLTALTRCWSKRDWGACITAFFTLSHTILTVTVNKLLAILGVSKQALNAPLRQLIEMKLIAVKIAERDKRVKQLSLTATGQKLENQLTSLQMQHLDTAFTVAAVKQKLAG